MDEDKEEDCEEVGEARGDNTGRPNLILKGLSLNA